MCVIIYPCDNLYVFTAECYTSVSCPINDMWWEMIVLIKINTHGIIFSKLESRYEFHINEIINMDTSAIHTYHKTNSSKGLVFCQGCPTSSTKIYIKKNNKHALMRFWTDCTYIVNTLRPRQNGCHFPDDIFKWIFLNENVWILLKIPLTFVLMFELTIFQHWFR